MEIPVYFEDLAVGCSFASEEVTVDNEEMLAYNRRKTHGRFMSMRDRQPKIPTAV